MDLENRIRRIEARLDLLDVYFRLIPAEVWPDLVEYMNVEVFTHFLFDALDKAPTGPDDLTPEELERARKEWETRMRHPSQFPRVFRNRPWDEALADALSRGYEDYP